MTEQTNAPGTIDHVIDAVRQAGGEAGGPFDTVEGLNKLSEQVDQLDFSKKERKKLKLIINTEVARRSLEQSQNLKKEVKELKKNPTWKKVLKWALIAGAVGLAGYLAWTYLPGWDQILAWIQRLRGSAVAVASTTGVGAPAMGAAPVTPNLIIGGATSTTPGFVGSATDLLEALDACPPIPPVALPPAG